MEYNRKRVRPVSKTTCARLLSEHHGKGLIQARASWRSARPTRKRQLRRLLLLH